MVRWAENKNIEADTIRLNGSGGQFLKMYLGSDNKLYLVDADGVEYEVSVKKVKPPKK